MNDVLKDQRQYMSVMSWAFDQYHKELRKEFEFLRWRRDDLLRAGNELVEEKRAWKQAYQELYRGDI